MEDKNKGLTVEEWKDFESQISELLDLTWRCARDKAETKTLELRKTYIDKVEAFIETGETYWDLDDELKQIAKQLKPPFDKHKIWEAIKPKVEDKLKEAYERVFKIHRKRGFDRVAKILGYVEKLGLPKEVKEATSKWLERGSKPSND